MPLGTGVGLGPGHIVLDWYPAPPPHRGIAPPFFVPYLLRPNGCMDQDATWYGGLEVGLGPGDFVLDRDPASPPQKGGGAPSPIFGPFLLWPNGWMHQDVTWYKVGLRTGDFVLDGDPAPSPKRGLSPSIIFGACLLWPNSWMDQDTT